MTNHVVTEEFDVYCAVCESVVEAVSLVPTVWYDKGTTKNRVFFQEREDGKAIKDVVTVEMILNGPFLRNWLDGFTKRAAIDFCAVGPCHPSESEQVETEKLSVPSTGHTRPPHYDDIGLYKVMVR